MAGMFISLFLSGGLFAKTYGGDTSDYGYSMIQAQDGGLVIAGSTLSFGGGNWDFMILKPSGSNTWARAFGWTADDRAYSIAQTKDGGYVVAGYTRSFGNPDILILKLNYVGNFSWATVLGGGNSDVAFSVTQTADGGCAVAGVTYSYGAGWNDVLVLKLDPYGNLSWAKTFGTAGDEIAFSIIQTADKGYMVVGGTWIYGYDNADCLIIKLDSLGTLSWAKIFREVNDELFLSVSQNSINQFYAVAGYTNSISAGCKDFLVLILNSFGDLFWAGTFGGANDDSALSVSHTKDGGCIVAGMTRSFGEGSSDFLVLKIAPNGYAHLSWATTFGGTDDEEATSVLQTSDKGYAVAGYTKSFGAGYGDFLVMKLDSTGNYPGCADTSSNLEVNLLSTGLSSVSLTTRTITPNTFPSYQLLYPLTLTAVDVCPPSTIEETTSGFMSRITCSPVPGGVMFNSSGGAAISIYSAEGRLVYLGNLEGGKNRVCLDRGVYLWKAGPHKGKVAIR